MKNLIKYFAFAILTFAIASCSYFEDEKGESSQIQEKTIVELPDSVKQHLIAQDSLTMGLVNKIDELTQELNNVKSEYAALKADVEKLESPRSTWNYLTLGALALALITFIMSFVRTKGLDETDVQNIFKDCLTNSTRFNALKETVDRLANSKSNANSRYAPQAVPTQGVEARLKRIEDQIVVVTKFINTVASSQSGANGGVSNVGYNKKEEKKKENEYSKVGYAKSNSGKYFFDILDSNQEGCVYSIKFKSTTKGEFDLISLDKIKSRNDWQSVIDWEGDVNITEASSYKLIRSGVIEKIDETTWEVKENLKIRFLK